MVSITTNEQGPPQQKDETKARISVQACFLCLGNRDAESNRLMKSCTVCNGAWVHRRCWKRWYQQQRIQTIKKAMINRHSVTQGGISETAMLCPICRTGQLKAHQCAVDAIDATFTELEEIQSKIYRVVLIAMEYVHSIRNQDAMMDAEYASLDSYAYQSVCDPRSWTVVLSIVSITVTLYTTIMWLGGGQSDASAIFPSISIIYSAYAILILWIGGWFTFVRDDAMESIKDTFELIENERNIPGPHQHPILLHDDTQLVMPWKRPSHWWRSIIMTFRHGNGVLSVRRESHQPACDGREPLHSRRPSNQVIPFLTTQLDTREVLDAD